MYTLFWKNGQKACLSQLPVYLEKQRANGDFIAPLSFNCVVLLFFQMEAGILRSLNFFDLLIDEFESKVNYPMLKEQLMLNG
jgi:hypothetical protein